MVKDDEGLGQPRYTFWLPTLQPVKHRWLGSFTARSSEFLQPTALLA